MKIYKCKIDSVQGMSVSIEAENPQRAAELTCVLYRQPNGGSSDIVHVEDAGEKFKVFVSLTATAVATEKINNAK